MVPADDQPTPPRYVLDAGHSKKSDQERARQRAHEPAHERVDHRPTSPLSTRLTMRSTTSSAVSLSVSITNASGAGRKGATARSVSRRSRRVPPRRITAGSTPPPRPPHLTS